MQHEVVAELAVPLQREAAKGQRRDDVVVEREQHQEDDRQGEKAEAQHAVAEE